MQFLILPEHDGGRGEDERGGDGGKRSSRNGLSESVGSSEKNGSEGEELGGAGSLTFEELATGGGVISRTFRAGVLDLVRTGVWGMEDGVLGERIWLAGVLDLALEGGFEREVAGVWDFALELGLEGVLIGDKLGLGGEDCERIGCIAGRRKGELFGEGEGEVKSMNSRICKACEICGGGVASLLAG